MAATLGGVGGGDRRAWERVGIGWRDVRKSMTSAFSVSAGSDAQRQTSKWVPRHLLLDLGDSNAACSRGCPCWLQDSAADKPLARLATTRSIRGRRPKPLIRWHDGMFTLTEAVRTVPAIAQAQEGAPHHILPLRGRATLSARRGRSALRIGTWRPRGCSSR